MKYVSRAGEKLEYAINHFQINVSGLTCADFGSNTGGFVDCLLQAGAEKVFAIETGYGVLDWQLRNNPKVIVMERTNAMHVELPEKVDFITIDTSWTKLAKIIPSALNNIKPNGHILALIKPHYEADTGMLRKGKLPEEFLSEILDRVRKSLQEFNVKIIGEIESPILGEKAQNKEFLIYLALGRLGIRS